MNADERRSIFLNEDDEIVEENESNILGFDLRRPHPTPIYRTGNLGTWEIAFVRHLSIEPRPYHQPSVVWNQPYINHFKATK